MILLLLAQIFHAVQLVQMDGKEVGMHIMHWTDKLLFRYNNIYIIGFLTDNVIIEDD